MANRSIWRQFPTVRNAALAHGNVVLLGDAAHTAHFSVGSGTKLAMEDAIALAAALQGSSGSSPAALAAYEAARRPQVESLQRAAQASLEWFEATERYTTSSRCQFAFNLLTRSLRITHENLKRRDPAFVARVDRWFAERARRRRAARGRCRSQPAPAARSSPRSASASWCSPNRVVVSPMCQYSAEDGAAERLAPGAPGSRAIGGAGLVMTEMTDVSARGPDLARAAPGCTADAHVAAWKRIVEFVHAESAAQDRHAARPRGPQGGSTKLLWEGDDEPLARGRLADHRAVVPFPIEPHNQVPTGDDRGPTWTSVAADFVRAAGDAPDGRVRPARAAPGARLPAGQLHLAADEPAHRRVRRVAREPDALPARGVRRRARGVARGRSRCRCASRRWTGHPGGLEPDGRGRGGAADRGRRGRHRWTCRRGRPSRTSAGLRPAVPDAVRRPDPPRGGRGDDGRRATFLEPRGRQHDPGGGAGRPGAAGAGAPLGPVLDPARGVRRWGIRSNGLRSTSR